MVFTFLIYFVILSTGVIIFSHNNVGVTLNSQRLCRLEVIYIILYTLIVGLRYDVGVDYHNYKELYDEYVVSYPLSPNRLNGSTIEPAYDALLKFMAGLDLHYSFFFIFNAFLNIYFLYIFARRYPKQEALILFFYIASMSFFDTFNAIRQMTAFFMYLCTIRYIERKQFFKYIISILAISCFHRSIFMMLPFYFFINYRIPGNRLLYIGLVFICYMYKDRISDFIWTVIFDGLLQYLTGIKDASYLVKTDALSIESSSGSLGLMHIIILFLDILIIWNIENLRQFYKSINLNIYFNLFLIGACLYFVSSGSITLIRLNMYFFNILFVMLAFLTYYYMHPSPQKSIIQQRLSLTCAVLVMAVSMAIYTNAILRGTKNSPYTFVYEHVS